MIEALTTIVQDRLLPPPDINDLIMPTVLANLGTTGMTDEVGSSSRMPLQNDALLQACVCLHARTHCFGLAKKGRVPIQLQLACLQCTAKQHGLDSLDAETLQLQ